MIFTFSLMLLALSDPTSGYAHLQSRRTAFHARNSDAHPWQPVPAGGVRAPCPGTNTLANHGYINRDGKNITAAAYRQGFFDAFGFGMNTLTKGTNNAVNLCSSLTGTTCTSFNLDILATPHRIEHDGSMTRCDKEMKNNPNADNNSFNQTIWDKSTAIYMDASGGSTHFGMQVANTVRLRRFKQARKADVPGWFIANQGGSLSEHSFILSAMNDPALGQNLSNPQAKFEWVDYWFTHERLPTDLGWVRPTATIPPLKSLHQAIESQPTIPPGGAPTTTSSSSAASVTKGPKARRELKKKAAADTVPLAAIPRIIKTPHGEHAVSKAGAAAVHKGPAPPSLPDAYEVSLTAKQFRAFGASAAAYVSEVQEIFKRKLAQILGGS